MRRNILCLTLLFAVLWTGCNLPEGPDHGKGTLTLLLPETAVQGAPAQGAGTQNKAAVTRSVISDEDRAALIYKLSFTGPGESQTIEVAEGGITLLLKAGQWTVEATAYNSETPDIMVGSGSAVITVAAGRNSSVRIPMKLDSVYEGTLTKIYIHNEEDLRRIAAGEFDISGAFITNFYLERDIVLTQPWSPIGNEDDPFKAKFNGQGHSITVKSFAPAKKATGAVYQGFFAVIEDTEIKNITVKYELNGVVDIRTGDSLGFADSYAGGLAGWAINTRFENVEFMGDFSVIADGDSSLNVGGIVGDGDDITITDCRVAGNISGNSANALHIGGIVGMANRSFLGTGLISGTSFTGDISGYTAVGNCDEGGIAGSSDLEITACFVEGRIKAKAGSPRVGGITGINTLDITKSYALGVIESELLVSNPSAYAYAGGIAGFNGDRIEHCYAWVNVKASAETVTPGELHAGGIVGKLIDMPQAILSQCYARGDVAVAGSANKKYVGGIVGYNDERTIEYCAALNDDISCIGTATGLNWIVGGDSGTFSETYTSNYRPSDGILTGGTNAGKDGSIVYPRADFKGPTAEQVYIDTTHLNWNFPGDWKFLPGYDYPVLAGQTDPPADLATLQ